MCISFFVVIIECTEFDSFELITKVLMCLYYIEFGIIVKIRVKLLELVCEAMWPNGQ